MTSTVLARIPMDIRCRYAFRLNSKLAPCLSWLDIQKSVRETHAAGNIARQLALPLQARFAFANERLTRLSGVTSSVSNLFPELTENCAVAFFRLCDMYVQNKHT
ncbi:hypothetical protein K443DRAFT_273846 [Laccaria amethystina LaAM-08-1]|uniref:Uncharacterized protein n=1 Tax=Laccaria amethystina LaAM-08-1 TaxID=1095629 RepID=A0A0C9XGG6_9AGAR|nr:hypothetical protein K443DRAFT_273846 [Laccaria amethystina LaAM-08-1]